MNEAEQLRSVMLFINAGLKVLSVRIVMVLTLFMTFSLFAYVVYDPEWQRVAAATLFAVLVFFPVTRLDQKQAQNRAIVEGD